jgi:hypothetical protein
MWLYIMRTDDGLIVKVGISGNVESRLLTMQAHSPVRLQICFSQELTRAKGCERYLHRVLMMYRIHGEWFRIDYRDAVREAKKACLKFADRRGEHQNEWRRKKPNIQLVGDPH